MKASHILAAVAASLGLATAAYAHQGGGQGMQHGAQAGQSQHGGQGMQERHQAMAARMAAMHAQHGQAGEQHKHEGQAHNQRGPRGGNAPAPSTTPQAR